MHFFGRLLWIIITVTMMGLAVSFAISNVSVISLSLWPLTHLIDLPIWLFGLGAFVFGGILGAILMGGQMLAIRAKLWHAQSQIKKLHKQSAPDRETDNSLILPQTPES